MQETVKPLKRLQTRKCIPAMNTKRTSANKQMSNRFWAVKWKASQLFWCYAEKRIHFHVHFDWLYFEGCKRKKLIDRRIHFLKLTLVRNFSNLCAIIFFFLSLYCLLFVFNCGVMMITAFRTDVNFPFSCSICLLKTVFWCLLRACDSLQANDIYIYI